MKNTNYLVKDSQVNSIFKAKPFVKWVGGKRSALSYLEERLPKVYNRYYEPFLGGGALFFKLQPNQAHLSDVNLKLIITYKIIKNNVEVLIKELKEHSRNNSKPYFLKMRKLFNKEKDPIKLAGLFIYLNKVCFNGLYRVNQQGEFNVPYGRYKNPLILDESNLIAIHKILKNAEIKLQTFDESLKEEGAFYYLDPPYYKTFDQYDKNKFNLNNHKSLSNFCKDLDKKRSFFMLSNSDKSEIRYLYKDFNIEKIQVSKSISCKADGRGKEQELIIRNYG